MRNIKELLIILRDNEQLFRTGLCGLSWMLKESRQITPEEYHELKFFIENNRPRWYSIHYSILKCRSQFYWIQSYWAPRKKWLNSQIKKLG